MSKLLKKNGMPRHLWVMLGHSLATKTISVLGFQMGSRQDAVKVCNERVGETPGVGSVEVFDMMMPTERLRYHLELWLVGEGLPADEARQTVMDLARQLGEEFKAVTKRVRRKMPPSIDQ
jgi:hypothetical protein